jgi:hypothetical protein
MISPHAGLYSFIEFEHYRCFFAEYFTREFLAPKDNFLTS